MLYDDTIVAIATPAGEGGLGVVRLSGPQAIMILKQLVRPFRRGRWQPFRMRYGQVLAADGSPIDEVLAVCMRAPHSFTAEDAAEISCHGGPLVLARVLERALACGARLAEPGEFSLRAFLNGRIDLAQAEATLAVITARTNASLSLAQAQLSGQLSRELASARANILAPLAYCTALVDFPEDEVEPQPITAPLQQAQHGLRRLLEGANRGMLLRQGARVALVGRPNAGKSSLLNALLRHERAIVTDIPGTTRDTIEETADLDGVPVVLIDTAGITTTDDLVEQIGVERSRSALAGADLVLLIVDPTAEPHPQDREVAELSQQKATILVINKSDLLVDPAAQWHATQAYWEQLRGVACEQVIGISALAGAGVDALAKLVAQQLGGQLSANTPLISSARQRDALQRALTHLEDALASHAAQAPADLIAIDLTAALHAIGEVTGESIGNDLLREIFSRFCIGK